MKNMNQMKIKSNKMNNLKKQSRMLKIKRQNKMENNHNRRKKEKKKRLRNTTSFMKRKKSLKPNKTRKLICSMISGVTRLIYL